MRLTPRRVFANPFVITLATGGVVGGCNTSNPPRAQHDAQIDAPDDTYVVTENPPPPVWQVEAGTTHLKRVWGSGPNDVYAVGDGGAILHSVGDGIWTAQPSNVTADLFSVWGSGPTDIYAGGFSNTLLHSTGNGVWTPQTIPNIGVSAIGGSGPNDVYILYANSAGQAYHSTGNGTWSPVTLGAASSIIITAWATSATDIYFGGAGAPNFTKPYIVHGPTNPTTETMPALPDQFGRDIFKIWGSSATDIYAVGNTNTILHSVGAGSWTLQAGPLATAGYIDLWGSGASDIYAVGNGASAFVHHSYGDGTWIDEDIPMSAPSGVWGSGPLDVYVVGDAIAHKRF